jgi:tRNA-dihydrouridine synthase A
LTKPPGKLFSLENEESIEMMSDILSIAPMIQWTDVYWRYMMRQITQETLLYTEMTMDNAILYNQSRLEDFLGPVDFKGPLALQLGGNDPIRLADAAHIAESKLISLIHVTSLR